MSYDEQRQLNIQKNKLLLESLGLDKPFFAVAEKVVQAKVPKPVKKRKAPQEQLDQSSAGSVKVARTDTTGDATDTGGRRRSQRNAGKTVDYNNAQRRDSLIPISVKSGVRTLKNDGPLGRESGTRVHDPKVFGSIPGVAVGTWWETREGCSLDAIHAPWVGGISGGVQGAYSVCLSGGYDDDVDLGYAFTYTGSGGRDLKGTKDAPKNLRTAPQSSDQSFDNNFNKCLQVSSETKKPVRVIRGYKLKSKWGPSQGYRYDGLYRVEKAWREKGLNEKGYLVCKYAFKRLDGQAPLTCDDEQDMENDKSPQEN